MTGVVFGDGSLRRHMLDLVATKYRRARTRWREPQMTDIEKQRQIEKRLAATISRSTPEAFGETRKIVDNRVEGPRN